MAMLAVPLLTSMGVSAATAATIGTVASVAGTIFSGLQAFTGMQTANAQAKAEAQQGLYQQKVADQNAGQERAASQRVALDERRKATIASSRAKALGAAGGGGSDPTVVNLVGDINTQGEYNALTALYTGEDRARSYEQGGDLAAYQGQIDSAATRAKGTAGFVGSIASTLTSAGKTLMDKYSPGPSPTTKTYQTPFGQRDFSNYGYN